MARRRGSTEQPFNASPGEFDQRLEELEEVERLPGGRPLETMETDLPMTEIPPESWDEFFEARDGNTALHVRRIIPETWPDPLTGKETVASGFCGSIPYGVEVEAYISERWGGGVYQVSLVRNHKYAKGRKVSIPGPPILAARIPPTYIPNAGPGQGAEGGAVLAVDPGDKAPVPLHGSRDDWEERLNRFAATQAMIRGMMPPDPNAALLQLVVGLISNAQKPGPADTLKDQLENLRLINELRADVDPPAGGGGVVDLIGKALEALPKLAALSALKKQPQAPPQLPPPGFEPAPGVQAAAELDQSPPAETDAMTAYQETIDRALETVVTHYTLPTRSAPAVVAGALMVAFPLPANLRQRVFANAAELAAYGLSMLPEETLAEPNTAGDWSAYVLAVLESYADPNRKGPLEGLKL